MAALEDWLEYLIKGSLLIAAAIFIAPFALGYVIAIGFWWVIDRIWERLRPEPQIKYPSEFELKAMHEKIEREALPPEPPKLKIVIPRPVEKPNIEELEPEEEQKRERKYEEPEGRPISLSGDLYLERNLRHWQKEHLIAKGYLRLKISPFGDSGAAYYLVNVRYNESKEHAFFCYILERELERYSRRITININNGPDLVVEYLGKKYAFDVETGKSLTRQPDYLERKFGHYEREYDQIFILVTHKSLKYKYSRYGYVITRGRMRETLAAIFHS